MATPIIPLDTILSTLRGFEKLSDKKQNDLTLANFAIQPTSLGFATAWSASSGVTVAILSATHKQDDVVNMVVKNASNSPCFDVEQHKDKVWLRYQLMAGVNLSSNLAATTSKLAGIPIDELGGKVGVQMKVSTYKVHANTGLLADALKANAKQIPSIFNKESLQHLQDNEAVSLQIGGNLEFGIAIKVNDLLFAAFNTVEGLKKIALPNNALALSGEAGATFTFDVALQDQFRLEIANKNNAYHFELTKDFSKMVGGTLSAGTAIGLKNPKQINQAIDAVITKFVPTDLATVDRLFKKLLVDNKVLEGDEIKDFEKIARMFGFTGGLTDFLKVSTKVSALQQQWQAWVTRVKEEIYMLVSSKLQASVKATYQKSWKTSKVLRGKFTSLAALQTHYGKLLAFDFQDLLAIPNEVVIEEWLLKKEITTSLAIGVEISLFNWLQFKLSSNAQTKFAISNFYDQQELLTNLDYESAREVALYYGIRSRINGTRYFSKFSVTTPQPVIGHITNRNTDYCLDLGFEWLQSLMNNKIDSNIIAEMVDLAYLWDIKDLQLRPNEIDKLAAYLQSKGQTQHKFLLTFKAEDAAWEVFMSKLEGTKFKKLVTSIAHDVAFRNDLATSLAGAMFYDSAYKCKKTFDSKVLFYSALWVEFFKNWSKIPTGDLRRGMRETYNRLGDSLQVIDMPLYDTEVEEFEKEDRRSRLAFAADLFVENSAFSSDTRTMFEMVYIRGFQIALEGVQNMLSLNCSLDDLTPAAIEKNQYNFVLQMLDSDFEMRWFSRFMLLFLKDHRQLFTTSFTYYQKGQEVLLNIPQIVGRGQANDQISV